MSAHVALLRAVNVSGRNLVPMARLRALCGDLGWKNVRTLIASGNVVFEATVRSAPAAERALRTAIANEFGVATEVFVRGAAEWAALVAANPFPKEAKADPAHLHALCLAQAPAPAALAALRAAIAGPERVGLAGRTLYAVYPDGSGRSKLTLPLIEAKLGTLATGRNWNTVLKLAGMLGE